MSISEAKRLFSDLENNLVAGRRFSLSCDVVSTGANLSRFKGVLDITDNTIVDLSFSGVFGKIQTDPKLKSDGHIMSGGSIDSQFELIAPPALTEALFIGFTRMGILHNLVRLSFGRPPEKAGGGVRDWIEVDHFRIGESDLIDGWEVVPLQFSLTTTGQSTTMATLWVDRRSKLPVQREQTVKFPNGPMVVTERYSKVDIY